MLPLGYRSVVSRETNQRVTGEGHFDDNKGQSGTNTPNVNEDTNVDGRGPKRKRANTTGKKAKTTKQRLAIADGEIDG